MEENYTKQIAELDNNLQKVIIKRKAVTKERELKL